MPSAMLMHAVFRTANRRSVRVKCLIQRRGIDGLSKIGELNRSGLSRCRKKRRCRCRFKRHSPPFQGGVTERFISLEREVGVVNRRTAQRSIFAEVTNRPVCAG
jgi:hypothetical protein